MFGDDLFTDEMTNLGREIKKNLFEDQQQQLESNVEKLSKLLEEPFDEYSEKRVMRTRMQIINLSAITESLSQKMYECIENDLLGSLPFTIHSIAPYMSKGIEKAEDVSSAQAGGYNNRKTVDRLDGDILEAGRATASGTSSERQKLSRKRARKGSSGGSVFDLNLPSEFHRGS